MAHGFTESDTMFSVGKKPWHELGTVLENAPLIDDAIKHAGLCWDVATEPTFTMQGEGLKTRAVRRMDTGDIIGEVGPNWQPLQNDKAFSFFQPFLDSGLASLETAGSIWGGKQVFILAKINSPDQVIVPQSDDKIEAYVLLSNSHEGGSVRVGFTPIRVVCNNTLTMAHSDKASKLIRVRHSASVEVNLQNIRETMNLYNQQFEATADQFRLLASVYINQADVKKYFTEVFRLKDEEATRKQRTMEQLVELFETGRGNHLEGVTGTAWAAYNAATEFMQYYSGRTNESRIGSLWFGPNEKRNRHALQTALNSFTGG